VIGALRHVFPYPAKFNQTKLREQKTDDAAGFEG
jgi:hypothetical protein